MAATQRPSSPAAERNAAPILARLEEVFAGVSRVLEIGSGTGQHAVHFAAAMPHLVWLTSDLARNHEGILAWLGTSNVPNVAPPLALDVLAPWPDVDGIDAAFTANTFHIMPFEGVAATFEGLAGVLPPGAPFVVYGPFAYSGRHTSDSNRRFDAELRAGDAVMGVRDLDDVAAVAGGFALERDVAMPANNRLLVWRRIEPARVAA